MKDFGNSLFKNSTRLLPISAVALYTVGFTMWNLFLARFGFFEYQLIETRFISAGLFSALLGLPAWLVLKRYYPSILRLRHKEHWIKSFIQSFLLIFIYFVIFLLFGITPQSFGGARPIPVSLLGSAEQIRYLQNFNIDAAPNGTNAPVQTGSVCLLYQNRDALLVGAIQYRDQGAVVRALTLKTNEIAGLQAVHPVVFTLVDKAVCAPFAIIRPWDFIRSLPARVSALIH